MPENDPTFPPRWSDGPHWKPEKGEKTREHRKLSRKAEAVEAAAKGHVRKRDRYCRFPLCGCDEFRLARHVAHTKHKGMGGNPKGDRSHALTMLVLCSARHRESAYSLDMGTIRVTPLTKMGTAGACVFEVLSRDNQTWFEVGRERGLHDFEPFTMEQRTLLTYLARERMLR